MSEIELKSLYGDIVGNQNLAVGSSRDDVWINTQEIEYLIYDQANTPTYLINNYFDDAHNNVESVWYNYQGDADNGEWLISQLRLSFFDENGNEIQRTWHNYDFSNA